MDYTVYKLYRNDAGYWEAAILTPASSTPTIFNGWDTSAEMVRAIKEAHSEGALRLTEYFFQCEIDKRTVHTPEMLAMLEDTYAGDLSECWVYGSILRPMAGIRIENAVYLNGKGAKYKGWQIHEYVVSPGPLDKAIIDHYDLVFISHP